jgi:hypothetical protein
MLQDWLARLSLDAGSRGLAIALAATAVGLIFSFVGARFSRSIFTLFGVAVGSWAGLRLPRWMGWEIDSMATAFGGALVVGLAGYLFHRMWVGITLGTLLAITASFIVWHRFGAAWTMPTPDRTKPLAEALRELVPTWSTLVPTPLRISIVAGFIGGGVIGWMWPKMSRVLAFAMLGTFLLAGGVLCATAIKQPQWLGRIPASTQTQGIALAILFVLSTAIQWALCPRMKKTRNEADDPRDTPPPAPSSASLLKAPRLVDVKLKETRA